VSRILAEHARLVLRRQRLVGLEALAPKYESGVLGKYARHVGSAADGAITS